MNGTSRVHHVDGCRCGGAEKYTGISPCTHRKVQEISCTCRSVSGRPITCSQLPAPAIAGAKLSKLMAKLTGQATCHDSQSGWSLIRVVWHRSHGLQQPCHPLDGLCLLVLAQGLPLRGLTLVIGLARDGAQSKSSSDDPAYERRDVPSRARCLRHEPTRQR